MKWIPSRAWPGPQGIELAKERGAQLVGLGHTLRYPGRHAPAGHGRPLTTGSSYTVVTAVEATISALNRLNIDPARAAAAVVGAAGSIGRCLALLLAESVEQLILLGNPAHPQRSLNKLAQVAGEVCRHLVTAAPDSPLGRAILQLPHCPDSGADAEAFVRFYIENAQQIPLTISVNADALLPQADVVVTATSSVSELVKPEHVRIRRRNLRPLPARQCQPGN